MQESNDMEASKEELNKIQSVSTRFGHHSNVPKDFRNEL